MFQKNYAFFCIFFLVVFAAGCIAENNSTHSEKSLNISQIYSTFNAPHSLEMRSLNEENNLTKIVYMDSERNTVIFTVQPDIDKPIEEGTIILINGVDVHTFNPSNYYIYTWIINNYRFSITGTNETISNDFMKQIISHTVKSK